MVTRGRLERCERRTARAGLDGHGWTACSRPSARDAAHSPNRATALIGERSGIYRLKERRSLSMPASGAGGVETGSVIGIFTERVPGLAAPFARRTARLAEIVRLLGHSADGRPSERLMRQLGMPVSDTTILAGLRKHARARSESSAVAAVHVAGVDDWAWRKGSNHGTIIVDLERREVVDVLADRSAATTASWFNDHPDVEVVSRDRAGLYAEAAGASPGPCANAGSNDRSGDLAADRGGALRQTPRPDDRQAANVDALKAASAEFTVMRRLAMRFRGLLRGGTAEGLDAWLIDARASGIYAIQRFARTIRQDLEAVRNAVSEPWSKRTDRRTDQQIEDPSSEPCTAALVSSCSALRRCRCRKAICTKSQSDPPRWLPTTDDCAPSFS